jgi:TolB-like protein/Tfp pilus assembly protein PilF
VHVYSLERGAAIVGPIRPVRRWRLIGAAVAIVVALAAGGYFLAPLLSVLHRASPSLRTMSENPSVAVLPFANQAGGARDYFSDGLTEDITTALGRFRELTVIAHAAVLPYRDKPLPLAELGRALNARYLVSGSVRRMDPRVRVGVQLTDATTGVQLWADQYDDQLVDIFEVQQRIARNVAGMLATNLHQIALQRSLRKPTGNLDAYDLLLRARSMAASGTRAGNRHAREALERVTQMSPGYADAHAELAVAYLQRIAFGWSEFAAQDVETAIHEAQKAADIDGENVLAHSVLARAYTIQQKYDLGLAEADRALQLNPSDTDALAARAEVLLWTGHIDQSIEAAELARRLNDDVGPEAALNLGLAYLLARRYSDAITLLETARARYPTYPLLDFPLAGAYAEVGRATDAASALANGLRKDPYLTLESFGTRFQDGALRTRVVESLRKAGLR